MELTVVQSNQLVEAAYALNLDEMRLIYLAISKINSKNGSPIGTIDIAPSEFISAFSINSKNIYSSLRQAVKGIGRKPIQLPQYGNPSRVKELYWLSSNEYDTSDNGTLIRLKFNSEIEPYLYDLKDNFTVIKFEQAAKLTTPFSFRLYQWLIKAKNMNSSKKGQTTEVVLDLNWIKSQAMLEGKYDRWDIFRTKVIEPSVMKINAKTDISLNWEPIRTGRKVSAIKFNYIDEKSIETKPLRPRLYRRPKVLKGSHEEGVWMRKNAELLLDYMGRSLEYDSDFKLTISDLKKLITYVSIYDSNLERQLKVELKERQRK